MVASPALIKYQWPYVQLSDFGGSADATAAVNSIALASAAATGLPIVIPPSNTTYKLASPFQMQTGMRMSGFGGGYSIFEAATDFGAGQYLFDANLATIGVQDLAPRLDGIGLKGLGSLVIGTAPCSMDGLKLSRDIVLNDVSVKNFNSNMKVCGDHISMRKVKSSNGLYSLDFSDDAITYGDLAMQDCDLTGALMASIRVQGSNSIDSASLVKVHLGFAPFGILRTGTTPTKPGMNNSLLFGCSFESIGNSAIRDDTTGGEPITASGVEFHQVGFSTSGTYNYASKDKDYALYLRKIVDSEIFVSRTPFTARDVGTLYLGDASDFTSLIWHLNDAETMPVVRGGTDSGSGIQWDRPGGRRGIFAMSRATVSNTDAVEMSQGYPLEVRRNGEEGRPWFGVACQAATANQIISVQTQGRASCKIGSVSVATGGVMLRSDGSVNLVPAQSSGLGGYQFADATAIASKQPIVGASARDYSSSSTGEVLLTGAPSVDRNWSAPSVSVLPSASATYDGQIFTVPGGGGVADVTSVCLKAAGGTYSWKTLATG